LEEQSAEESPIETKTFQNKKYFYLQRLMSTIHC